MNFEEKVNEEMKNAMKSGDKLRLETMRSLRAGIIEFSKSGVEREMTEDDVQTILLSNAKKRREAIDLFRQGNRPELVEKEETELAIIQEFLPKQLSEDEVRLAVQGIIAEIGASGKKDFGRVIGAAMKELRGKVDGNLVQSTVKLLLEE